MMLASFHPSQARSRRTVCRALFESLEGRRLLSFSAPTSYPLEFGVAAVLSADFNHDNRLDLATIYPGVSVFLGDGHGGFGAPSQFGRADGALTGVTADFNNDGHPDVATLNDDRSLSVWRGNGDGTFRPAVKTAIASWGELHSMAAADFNGDGKMDLVYSAEENYLAEWGSVEVRLGDGQGGFPTRHVYQLDKKNPNGLAVADLNGDGRADVVTTNYGNHDGFVSVLLGNGDGTVRYNPASSNFASGLFPQDVAVGDFTSDGIPDLATTSNAAGYSLSVLPGRGDGTFAAQIQTLAFVGNSLVAADFNGDGRLDIFMAREPDDFEYLYPGKLFLGHGNATFESPADIDLGGDATSRAVAGDFNGDGRLDLAEGFTDYTTYGLTVALNDGVFPSKIFIGPGGNVSGGNWSAASNWTPSGVPSATDVVLINGWSVTMPANATFASINMNSGAGLSFPNSTSIGSWNGSAYTGITGEIQSGRIRSYPASPGTAIGVAAAAGGTVLVKHTYAGDANLDGKIDVDDYGRIDLNIPLGTSGWNNGDFNYDGKINVDDYGIIDFNVGIQGAPLGNAAAVELPRMPEPLRMREEDGFADPSTLITELFG